MNMVHVVKIGTRVRQVLKDLPDNSLIVEGLLEGYDERILWKAKKRIGTNPINGRIYSRKTTIG